MVKVDEMEMQLVKIEGFWTVLGYRADGSHFDYRFTSKTAAEIWIGENK